MFIKNVGKIFVCAILVAQLEGCVYEDHGWHWHHHDHPAAAVVYVH